MRKLSGKSARLTGVEFDRYTVNGVVDKHAAEVEAKLAEEQAKLAEVEAAKKAAEEAELKAKQDAVVASHEETEKEA